MFKKFLASLCAIVVLALMPIVITLTVLRYTVLTPLALKQAVRSAQVGESLPSIMDTVLQKNDEFDAVIVKELLPPTEVYSIVDQVIDLVWVWWKTDQPLEQLVSQIRLGTLSDRINQLVDIPTQPNQLFDIPQAIQQWMVTNPAQVKIITTVSTQIRAWLEWIAQILLISQIVTIVSLVLMVVLRLPVWRSVWRWLGLVALLAGLEVLVSALVLFFVPQLIIILAGIPNYDVVMTVVSNVLTTLLRPGIIWLLWLGGGMVVSGILLQFVAHWCKKPQSTIPATN
ncbi:MAG: hypothetical protein HYV33_01280 [Candidatus Kerfeldbacteria bacterium]|nr:hypothetical protein [Candidatus Kerfeldbacteria bacterium]